MRFNIKKGVENKVVDALSRRNEKDSTLLSLSTTQATWIEEVCESYESNPLASQLLSELSISPSNIPDYSLQQGAIRYKHKIYIGRSTTLKTKILEVLHQSPIGGHSGQQGTYRRIQSMFYWPNMKTEKCKWVSECDVCQRVKSENIHPPGLLQPLHIPTQAWQDISLDFVEGLPNFGHKNAVLVVVDRLAKYGHFLALKHPYTAQDVSELFLKEIYRLHGLPRTIVSNRDVIFTSHFWQHLFKTLGTKLNMSTAYHPQSDGQTERLNRCMETYLRAMVFNNPKQWGKWLHSVEWWYNTNYHNSIKTTLF